MYRVGIDVGGTFTDLYILEEGQPVTQTKVPSTPHDYSEGVMAALGASGIPLEAIDHLIHGSTIATNALIQRRTAPTAFLTTEGFRDLVSIGRYHRPHLYDPYQRKPAPLVRRRHTLTVAERMDAHGREIVPLDECGVREAARRLCAAGICSVAVGFLNAYVNPAHEDRVQEILREEFPDLTVSLSSDIGTKIGALPRFVTTIINAGLRPLVQDYLERLLERLRGGGFGGSLWIILSNGGMAGIERAGRRPELTFVSGPAAGVSAGAFLAEHAHLDRVITLDMGGTSCDVAIVEDGDALVTTEYEIDFDMPLLMPTLDVHTIGAGGGSIAWIDEGGSLRVGPRSAGAEPGPACYGRGGSDPTVTDADLVIGYLSPSHFLGGRMRIEAAAAEGAIDRLAGRLGLSRLDTARGIVRVVEENMAAAIREVTIDRGRDPRDFALVAFGGAGPMHGAALMRLLSVPLTIVPPHPGVLSALGATVMPIKHDVETTFYRTGSELDPGELNRLFGHLEERALATVYAEEASPEWVDLQRTAEMRYIGQTYEVPVRAPGGEFTASEVESLIRAFHEEHERIYGIADRTAPVALVNARVTVVAHARTITMTSVSVEEIAKPEPREWRDVFFGDSVEWTPTPIYDRSSLRPGMRVAGPCIVEQDEATTVIPPDMSASVDGLSNLVIVHSVEGQTRLAHQSELVQQEVV